MNYLISDCLKANRFSFFEGTDVILLRDPSKPVHLVKLQDIANGKKCLEQSGKIRKL